MGRKGRQKGKVKKKKKNKTTKEDGVLFLSLSLSLWLVVFVNRWHPPDDCSDAAVVKTPVFFLVCV